MLTDFMILCFNAFNNNYIQYENIGDKDKKISN